MSIVQEWQEFFGPDAPLMRDASSIEIPLPCDGVSSAGEAENSKVGALGWGGGSKKTYVLTLNFWYIFWPYRKLIASLWVIFMQYSKLCWRGRDDIFPKNVELLSPSRRRFPSSVFGICMYIRIDGEFFHRLPSPGLAIHLHLHGRAIAFLLHPSLLAQSKNASCVDPAVFVCSAPCQHIFIYISTWVLKKKRVKKNFGRFLVWSYACLCVCCAFSWLSFLDGEGMEGGIKIKKK